MTAFTFSQPGPTDVQHHTLSNLAVCPGFEDFDPENPQWAGNAEWSIVASNPRNGSFAAKCLPTVEGSTYEYDNASIVDCQAGQYFYIGAWCKGVSVTGTTPRAGGRIRWLNASKGLISTSDAGSVAPGSYVHSAAVLQAPAGAVYAQPAVRVTGSSGGTWYADDVEFREALLVDWFPPSTLPGLDPSYNGVFNTLFLTGVETIDSTRPQLNLVYESGVVIARLASMVANTAHLTLN